MHRLRSFLSPLKPTRLGVLFAVLIGLGVGFWQWGRPPRPRVTIEGLGDRLVFGPFFSPDGQMVTFNQGDPDLDTFYLTLWDSQTGEKRFDFHKGGLRDVRTVLFSPDGRTLACITEKRSRASKNSKLQIRLWDVSSGKEMATFDEKGTHAQLAFSPQGRLMVLRDNSVLWDVAENKIVKKLVLKGEEIIGRGEMLILVRSQGGIFKIWNLATATLDGERRDILPPEKNSREKRKKGGIYLERIWDNCYLIHSFDTAEHFVFDLDSGQRTELDSPCAAAITPYGKTIAQHDYRVAARYVNNWWTTFMIWLGLQSDPMTSYVTLNAFPCDEEIIALSDCALPQFSPDSKTLAGRTRTGGSLQLWDLPIRKPIGKILGLAGLAAVATLLVFKGFGRLRRRRSSPANGGFLQHYEI
jgi:WD40 repeat protein